MLMLFTHTHALSDLSVGPRVRGQGYTGDRAAQGTPAQRRRSQPGSAQPQSLPTLTALFLESVARHRHCAAKFTHTAEQLVMTRTLAQSVPKAMLETRMHTPLAGAALHRDCQFVTLRRYQ